MAEPIARLIEAAITVGLTAEQVKDYKSTNAPLTPAVLSVYPEDYRCPVTLPLFCFPWGAKMKGALQRASSDSFPLIVPVSDGRYFYGACLLVYESVNSSLDSPREEEEPSSPSAEFPNYTPISEQIHYTSWRELAPKCYVLLSKLPYLNELKTLLHQVYFTSKGGSLHQHLAYLVKHLTLQQSSCCRIGEVVVRVPQTNQLPFSGCNFEELFRALCPENVVKVLIGLCVEENVVLVSSSPRRLTECSLALVTLLFPFTWVHLFYPVLPEALVNYLHSAHPYLVGIHPQQYDAAARRCRRGYFVNLDADSVTFSAQRSFGSSRYSKEPIRPTQVAQQLLKELACLTRGSPLPTEAVRRACCKFFAEVCLAEETISSPRDGSSEVRLLRQMFRITRIYEFFKQTNNQSKAFFVQFTQRKPESVLSPKASSGSFTTLAVEDLETSAELSDRLLPPPVDFDTSLNYAKLVRKPSEGSRAGQPDLVLRLWVDTWLYWLDEQPPSTCLRQVEAFANTLQHTRLSSDYYRQMFTKVCSVDFGLGSALCSRLAVAFEDIDLVQIVSEVIESHAVSPQQFRREEKSGRSVLKKRANVSCEKIHFGETDDSNETLHIIVESEGRVLCTETCKLLPVSDLRVAFSQYCESTQQSLVEFRLTQSTLFWNLIYLFYKQNFKYEFLVPFKSDLVEDFPVDKEVQANEL